MEAGLLCEDLNCTSDMDFKYLERKGMPHHGQKRGSTNFFPPCIRRESNPELGHGKTQCYRYTTNAQLIKVNKHKYSLFISPVYLLVSMGFDSNHHRTPILQVSTPDGVGSQIGYIMPVQISHR